MPGLFANPPSRLPRLALGSPSARVLARAFVSAAALTSVGALVMLGAPVPADAGFRAMEPVVLPGSSLPALTGVPVADVHAYAYQGGAWVAIPFQIDERSPDGNLFLPDDGLWDANDDLVFQPQDGGDPAPASAWLDDPESRTRPRTQLICWDGVEMGSRYVYLFLSSTLVDPPTASYVTYDAGNEQVIGNDYLAGFDPVGKFWDELRVDEGAGWGLDFIDRQKTRILGHVLFVNFTLTEEDYTVTGVQTKVGPVRLTRRSTGYYSILGIHIDGLNRTEYFGAYIGSPADTMDVNSAIDEVRMSLDLSTDAIGATLSDPMNAALQVDGIPDGGVQTTIPSGVLPHFWAKALLGASSVVLLGDFAGVSPVNLVYYHDEFGGGTLDGTDDTGDGISIGDYGIWIQQPVAATHVIRRGTFVGVGSDLSGPTCQAYFDTPIEVGAMQQSWDPTATPEPLAATAALRLEPPQPNPSVGATRVRFALPEAGRVDLSVYDVSGRLVDVLVDGVRSAGAHGVTWRPKALGPGVYWIRLVANGDVRVEKSTVIR